MILGWYVQMLAMGFTMGALVDRYVTSHDWVDAGLAGMTLMYGLFCLARINEERSRDV